MQLRFRSILLVLAAGFVVTASSFSSRAQQAGSGADATTPAAIAPAAIPEAPTPQIELVAAVDPQPGQAQNTNQPATRYGSEPGGAPNNNAAQSTSSSQTLTKTQHRKPKNKSRSRRSSASWDLPAFNISYRCDAVSHDRRPEDGPGLPFRNRSGSLRRGLRGGRLPRGA